MALQLNLTETSAYKLVEIVIDGTTDPQEFATEVALIEPKLAGKLAVLLSGRGPVWGFAMLAHAAHATPAVATFDPRLGYVVVQSHSKFFYVGEVISLGDQA